LFCSKTVFRINVGVVLAVGADGVIVSHLNESPLNVGCSVRAFAKHFSKGKIGNKEVFAGYLNRSL